MNSSAALETRFAHTHILGGSGHGKTQLLQTLIYRDLQCPAADRPSIVVIDSQGDLIRTISKLSLFDPTLENSLAEELLLIDPRDIDHPPAINLFDANQKRISSYGTAEKEQLVNGTIELYEYFFSALLGAGLSQKQSLIFRYLARLMLSIDKANIHTLRELLDEPEKFQGEIAKLDGTDRMFFEQQFFDKSFDETRTQVARRLWGMLANRTFERIFSSRVSKIDLFDAMNTGKIILINTSKDLLKKEGSSIFGRFFVAMIAQAAMERALIERSKRRPCFVYIDEAQDYFDDNIDHLLEQARKYKVGLVLAHQSLGQLTTKLKSSIAANTATKFVGGLSAADATALAKEAETDAAFLRSMKKTTRTASFAYWVKGSTKRPQEVIVKLGVVDRLPQMSSQSYQDLLARNRERYCVAQSTMPEQSKTTQPPEALESISADSNQASPSHSGLLSEIKKIANDRGFFAQIEAPVLEGKGRVDVLLEREGIKIAVEVSIKNKLKDELANLRKCLEAGFNQICLISPSPLHRDRLAETVAHNLDQSEQQAIHVFEPDQLPAYLDELSTSYDSTGTTVRGYNLSVQRLVVKPGESRQLKSRFHTLIVQALMTNT